MQGYIMSGKVEELRPPRTVQVGLIQNSIVLPTTEPLKEQRNALHLKIQKYVDYAATCGVNMLCLQEAWGTSENLDRVLKQKLKICVNVAHTRITFALKH